VAGGVERPEQVEMLRRLGCGRAQGSLFGAPAPDLTPDLTPSTIG
jgi:EAL domain-containing protein (putative c-di-GMP-specific phosphodiesterase class I)